MLIKVLLTLILSANILHMVVNTKADRQHAIAFALELPSTWAKKVDYYNLVVHMANV